MVRFRMVGGVVGDGAGGGLMIAGEFGEENGPGVRVGLELVWGIGLSCRWEGSGNNVVDGVQLAWGWR